MVKKAIDSRIPALIRNGVQEKKRSFFVIVGDRQKDVIVNLYHILLNIDLKLNKSVLWAYKNRLLGFSSHRKKREKKIKKEIKRGIRDVDTEDPFELFVSTQNIRYVYYKETDRILGSTHGMCIMQDFEAITPNLLARTIETVEGGGLVLLVLNSMKSLKQLYTMSMEVHARYRTEAHGDVVARFNERFILSLGSCESCLVVDDELNVLPISGGKYIRQLPPPNPDAENAKDSAELKSIKESLADTIPTGPLMTLAKTVDQAKAFLTFVDTISEKSLRSTVTLTAARGRGKSAALGVAIAAAVAHGYSNIFVTSPSPENLKTLFEFIFKGFDALDYMDHSDYSIIQSTNPKFNKAIVRVNIYRQHRQTIQYIQPEDAFTLGQAELLVIDEAAAIPLPLVRKLLGPYLVFMASTINGYEGTGRSLSLKLIQQLRDQSTRSQHSDEQSTVTRLDQKPLKSDSSLLPGRTLREITLAEPIRYAPGDGVEKWLNKLLCLDATLPKASTIRGTPHPSQCDLLQVNRDTLFSFHPVSERFLQKMMALYVAAHYKNQPNDLQLMSDAPAHQLFVLVPPVEPDSPSIPEPLCVVQVVLEGQISRESVLDGLSRGQRAGGDLIPWLVSQQFQDENFAALSGARVIRIATNPDYMSMGYGTRALQLLIDFYSGLHTSLQEDDDEPEEPVVRTMTDEDLEASNLLQDNIKVRDVNSMPPLFSRLSERAPPQLDYIGVSFGLTSALHKFWKRAKFAPVYLRQTPNDLTGEHTCVMLRTLSRAGSRTDSGWLSSFVKDFHKRFLSLLSYQFREFPAVTALSIDESAHIGINSNSPQTPDTMNKKDLDVLFSPYDLKRLNSYADNMLDYHVILDMLPTIANLYFSGRIRASVSLSGVQTALLLGIGSQRKSLNDLEKELNLQSSQLLAMFVKVIRKISNHFHQVVEGAVALDLPTKAVDEQDEDVHMNGSTTNGTIGPTLKALDQSLEDDLADAGDAVKRAERERVREMIDALPLERYEVAGGDADWELAEQQIADGKSSNVSVKSKLKEEAKKRKAGEALKEVEKEAEKERDRSKKSKKSKKTR